MLLVTVPSPRRVTLLLIRTLWALLVPLWTAVWAVCAAAPEEVLTVPVERRTVWLELLPEPVEEVPLERRTVWLELLRAADEEVPLERRTVWLELLLRFVVAADELFRTEEEELVAVVERVEEVE